MFRPASNLDATAVAARLILALEGTTKAQWRIWEQRGIAPTFSVQNDHLGNGKAQESLCLDMFAKISASVAVC